MQGYFKLRHWLSRTCLPFYFPLCCKFINKMCICDTRARNAAGKELFGQDTVAVQRKTGRGSEYQRANKNRKPCIAPLPTPVPPPISRQKLACFIIVFATRCGWLKVLPRLDSLFALVFHPALTFTSLSLILSCTLFGRLPSPNYELSWLQAKTRNSHICISEFGIYLSSAAAVGKNFVGEIEQKLFDISVIFAQCEYLN